MSESGSTEMAAKQFLMVDGRSVEIEGERNLLEIARKAHVDIPTFCYHSELSVYGACRLCLLEVEGRGLVSACSTAPEAGMKVKTTTEEIREIRRIAVELLLANHDQNCLTCPKTGSCQLQTLARKLGIERVRFSSTHTPKPLDTTTPSLVRNPNKCILCGDCVRFCHEIQGIGAIDFARRGHEVCVAPAFGKELDSVECVSCGQCAVVCPTGAITPRSEVDDVWAVVHDPRKHVVAQIAPAVRVALGEHFGLEPGALTTGKIAAALKAIGFDRVYDTSFAADLTVVEEANEFIARKLQDSHIPQFTSCCPGWVKFAEQYYPELLPHLSSCRSPQQMLGSLAKEALPAQLNRESTEVVMVSVMPCTAKKFEARRPEFCKDGVPDVDFVLTTQELARMIEEAGLCFHDLEPASLDQPMGFKTGAGVIFGASGGVTEAVLRYAYEKLSGQTLEAVEFEETRGDANLRVATVTIDGLPLKLAIVHGLAKARELCEQVKAGTADYDLIEVMACPGGCIGGAGQPVAFGSEVRRRRARGLYDADKMLHVHKSQENPYVRECYATTLGRIGGEKAHELLHTHYHSRRRITDEDLPVTGPEATAEAALPVSVCVGTSCLLRGSQDLLRALVKHLEETGLDQQVNVRATFCFERCDRGPTVRIGNTVIEKCTLEKARTILTQELSKEKAPV